jgi:hypothetical protein
MSHHCQHTGGAPEPPWYFVNCHLGLLSIATLVFGQTAVHFERFFHTASENKMSQATGWGAEVDQSKMAKRQKGQRLGHAAALL